MAHPLGKHYPEASKILNVLVFSKYGGQHWAQARFLVHLIDDVLWTNDPAEVAEAIREELLKLQGQKEGKNE